MVKSEFSALRKKLHLTQNQVSYLIGCHRSTISRWENNVVKCPVTMILLLKEKIKNRQVKDLE